MLNGGGSGFTEDSRTIGRKGCKRELPNQLMPDFAFLHRNGRVFPIGRTFENRIEAGKKLRKGSDNVEKRRIVTSDFVGFFLQYHQFRDMLYLSQAVNRPLGFGEKFT